GERTLQREGLQRASRPRPCVTVWGGRGALLAAGGATGAAPRCLRRSVAAGQEPGAPAGGVRCPPGTGGRIPLRARGGGTVSRRSGGDAGAARAGTGA